MKGSGGMTYAVRHDAPLSKHALSDAEWDRLQRLLPPRSPHARLRRHSLRSIFDALFYLLRTSRPWHYLPANFPPWQTVYYHLWQFCRPGLWTPLWRELRTAERHIAACLANSTPSTSGRDCACALVIHDNDASWGDLALRHLERRRDGAISKQPFSTAQCYRIYL